MIATAWTAIGYWLTTRSVASSKKRKPSSRRTAKPADVIESALDEESGESAAPAAVGGSGRFKSALVIVAALYFVTVWLDGIGSNLPVKLTPRVWLYFSQVAALFKNAGMMAIDYRAEGWSCSDKKWIEVDVRPWFLIDAETKENRFHRALQFYRKERKVMQTLEEYVLRRNNDSSSRPKIGGVRFLSLRIPYPKVGEHIEPMHHKPLAEYPENVRHEWYWTPTSRRYERCGDTPPPRKPKEGPESKAPKPSDDDERSFSPAVTDKDKDEP